MPFSLLFHHSSLSFSSLIRLIPNLKNDRSLIKPGVKIADLRYIGGNHMDSLQPLQNARLQQVSHTDPHRENGAGEESRVPVAKEPARLHSSEMSHVQDDILHTPENVSRVEKALHALEKINSMHPDARYRFQINDKTGKIQVAIINVETGDVMDRIPSSRVLEFASALEKVSGIFLEKKV